METVMPMNGFMELTEEDLMIIDGGVNWGVTLGGTALLISAIGLTIATGGLGFMPVSVILGAGTGAEIAIAGVATAASALSGTAIGYGLTH
ncbi:hypothetical protein Thexy_0748 [Thermoanaerobacterium xylanolyticum LX-11]|uniref:Bacteriocin-type signal sequence n=1 Tax=Thermoanaerobacterium xylanolyticum (strain ATCC 49914 / DSM 7097 / LX-11) TaxID=858215 RepID=F6BIP9_THEXL|nr:hypothetical protein [Thermoanaerobacterium xylanolyticum]AEF16793.1 hypothetical protein Thexy_0748 [Thermoanaerobacterium xylanolyticum LX-11]